MRASVLVSRHLPQVKTSECPDDYRFMEALETMEPDESSA